MASLFGFSSPVDLEIRLEDEHDRKTVDIKAEQSHKETCPIYYDGESVTGTVRV